MSLHNQDDTILELKAKIQLLQEKNKLLRQQLRSKKGCILDLKQQLQVEKKEHADLTANVEQVIKERVKQELKENMLTAGVHRLWELLDGNSKLDHILGQLKYKVDGGKGRLTGDAKEAWAILVDYPPELWSTMILLSEGSAYTH